MNLIVTQQSPPSIIEKHRLKLVCRRARARLDTIAGADFLLTQIAEDLEQRLAVIKKPFHKALILAPRFSGFVNALGRSMRAATVQLDERVLHDEYLPVDDFDFDLIVSIGQLHLINDVPGMLSQLKQRLRPDGLLLACVPGANTIANIRECWISAEAEITGGLSSRFLPLFDVRTAGSLLQRTGYSLPVTDIDEVSVSYRDTRQIFADLRSMAATNVLVGGQGHAVTRKLWEKFNQKLTARRDSHGKLPASYELIWMSGWAPSPTQQKPLKPGSAEISLADVLKGLE